LNPTFFLHILSSIVEIVTNLGKALGAYKMTLDCKDSMIPFYEGLGYGREAGNANTLSIRYPVTEAKL
jgi:glucosamine-phosphate N-acetyltransferase